MANKKTKVVEPTSNVPKVADKDKVFRNIRYKADVKTLVVRTEIGYDLVFELNPQIRINPYSLSEKGTPEFQTSVMWVMKGARPKGNAMKLPEITKMIKDRSVLPMEVDWDIAQLGFVYSNNKDPNNHKWWIEALKTGKTMGKFDSILSEYPKIVESTAPIGTRSWFDGIFHGRFTFNKDSITDVKEISPGHIMINGNGKGGIGDIVDNVPIPDECTIIRLRFDIRKDHWIAEMLNDKGTVVGAPIISKQIKSDAKFKGHVKPDPNRPKVSGVIKREDIVAIKADEQLMMIKGKK